MLVEDTAGPPEVRTSILISWMPIHSIPQISFDIEDFALKMHVRNECWNIWTRARPWLESHGYYLYDGNSPPHPPPPPPDMCTVNQHPYAIYPAGSSLQAFNKVCGFCLRLVVLFTAFIRPRWCSHRTRAGVTLCLSSEKLDRQSPVYTRCLRATSAFSTLRISLVFFLRSAFCNGALITVPSFYPGMPRYRPLR
jgi:hypothetical protein